MVQLEPGRRMSNDVRFCQTVTGTLLDSSLNFLVYAPMIMKFGVLTVFEPLSLMLANVLTTSLF